MAAVTHRDVITGDAFEVLPRIVPTWGSPLAIVTNPPDPAEIGIDIGLYHLWLERAARLCFGAAGEQGVTMFAVTDRRAEGGTLSKAAILLGEGQRQGQWLLWHKIALRRAPGKVDLFRPTYTHLLAFTRGSRGAGVATPDVIEAGKPSWRNGLGWEATKVMVEAARPWSPVIVDPFAGQGTTLAAAEGLYAYAFGIEIDPERAEEAKTWTP